MNNDNNYKEVREMIIDEDDLFDLTEQEFIEKYDCTKEQYEYYQKDFQEM